MFNLLLCGSWPVLKSNPLAGGKSLLQTVLNVHGEQNSPSGGVPVLPVVSGGEDRGGP